MQIKRITPESSIDYTGKLGPVIFSYGCNFRCPFCHNSELIEPSASGITEEDKQEILDKLEGIKNKAKSGWYNGVCISGGEPTLHPGLFDFCAGLRGIGLSVKLDTNASQPEVIKQLIEESLVDYFAIDIKSSPSLYNLFTGVEVNLSEIEESLSAINKLKEDEYEFRTTLAPHFSGGKLSWMNDNQIDEMARWLAKHVKKESRWYLQKFISRDKQEIYSSKLSLQEIPLEFKETPDSELERAKLIIQKYFPNVEIR